MGCKALSHLTPSNRTTLSSYSGHILAIDAVHWFDRYLYAARENLPGSPVIEYNGKEFDITQAILLLESLPDLLKNNITPVFFFDPDFTSPSGIKKTKTPHLESTPRKGKAEEHTPYLQRPTEILLQYLDIDYYKAVRTAEADASVFVREGYADAVVSKDYDTILYRADITLRKNNNSGRWEEWRLKQILNSNDITYRELLDTAILLGTDEVNGPYPERPEEALQKVKSCKNINKFEKKHNSMLRNSSLSLNDPVPSFSDLHNHYSDPPTKQINEYNTPNFPDPDLLAAVGFLHEYLNYPKPKEIVTQIQECV